MKRSLSLGRLLFHPSTLAVVSGLVGAVVAYLINILTGGNASSSIWIALAFTVLFSLGISARQVYSQEKSGQQWMLMLQESVFQTYVLTLLTDKPEVSQMAKQRLGQVLKTLSGDQQVSMLQFIGKNGLPAGFVGDALVGSESLVRADLRQAQLPQIQLAGADLTGVNLQGANLAGADLSRARVTLKKGGSDAPKITIGAHSYHALRADFSQADLSQAHLNEADLTGADLAGANLQGADLTKVNLCYANLQGANLKEAKLSETALIGAHLQGADLTGADLTWAVLDEADLRGAVVTKEQLNSVVSKRNARLD